jgi:glycolate oxidase FAD binding subunit
MESVVEGTSPTVRDAALDELVDRVRAALADGTAADDESAGLCIRGSGSKDFLGGPIQGELLSTTGLRGISSYEPSELVITARAGTPVAEIEAALAEKGQCLAFEPPRYETGGTVGGMVAAGLAGPSRAAVGGVRDFMLGATLLNGRAEVLSFGGQVMKNVAGYDVSRLLAGSMGVLGLILEVSLKVLPVTPATATLRFDCDERSALAKLNEWGGQPLPIHASAWWDGVLVVRLSGARAAVESAQRRLGGEVIPPDMAAEFWSGLRDQRDEFFTEALGAVQRAGHLWRVAVPQTAAPLGIKGLGSGTLIEWGGAQRWVVTAEGDTATEQALIKAARQAGGHAQIFRGPRSGTTLELDPVLLRIHRQLKTAFDPQGLFNRGRLHPEF